MDSGRNRPSGRYRDQSYEERYEREYEQRPRYWRRPAPKPEPEPELRKRPRRRRRAWPVLLTGCGLGVFLTVLVAAVVVFLAIRSSQGGGLAGLPALGALQTFTHEDTQQIPLTTISQMQICNKIGNVSVMVDPRAAGASITTKKIVHANSQNDANQEFKRIGIEVQPPGTITNALTCASQQAPPTANGTPAAQGNPNSALTVNTTIPNSEGLLHNSNDAVDIAITLPTAVLPSTGPSMLVDIEAPVGNVTVDGLSGALTIKGSTGDVTVTHAILIDGSHIATDQGNVTFNGLLVVPPAGQTSRYMILSEQGSINVTLPENTNVILDANTNVGSINSDFNIPVQNNNGSGPVSYHGPFNPAIGPQPAATLVLDISTGNVNIHKAAQ
ncbi:MAG TPA: hypothetical protein VFB60_27760 [Ktedonobacteraceae bacterium]|nr:hypothetical protein [Ktedonobacteraceae bacterium]